MYGIEKRKWCNYRERQSVFPGELGERDLFGLAPSMGTGDFLAPGEGDLRGDAPSLRGEGERRGGGEPERRGEGERAARRGEGERAARRGEGERPARRGEGERYLRGERERLGLLLGLPPRRRPPPPPL